MTKTHEDVFYSKSPRVRDFLETSFGTYPPNGVDPVIAPNQKIIPHTFADLTSPENKQTYKVLISEKAGIAYDDQGPWLKAFTSFVTNIASTNLRLSRQLSCRCVIASREVFKERAIFYNTSLLRPNTINTFERATLRIMQEDHATGKEPEAGMLFENAWPRTGWLSANNFLRRHCINGPDLQMHLQDSLLTGYRVWNTLPENKIELWAALNAIGCRLPDEIRNTLSSTSEGREAQARFKPVSNFKDHAGQLTRQLKPSVTKGLYYGLPLAAMLSPFTTGGITSPDLYQKVPALLSMAFYATGTLLPFCAHLIQKPRGVYGAQLLGCVPAYIRNKEDKLDYLDKTLPALYGDLLEMYGDREGRAKMGLGRNEKLAGSWLKLVREDKDSYSAKEIATWLDALTPLEIHACAAQIIRTMDDEKQPNDPKLLDTLLSRNELKESLTSHPDTYAQPLLVGALTHNREDYVRQLLEAGCSLTRQNPQTGLKPFDAAEKELEDFKKSADFREKMKYFDRSLKLLTLRFQLDS